MQDKFDLVVIGTGTAGSTVASQCRAAGWSVAVIDSLPFGGTREPRINRVLHRQLLDSSIPYTADLNCGLDKKISRA